ncbi:c-type cytochrome [Flavobacterium sp. GA093]|uniref:C-type cytochrome n=1 Tax=Flavobacterium hydrocarbonoxydans TaxID=2683249 RepID=A0A6I4NT23_9FLAO|nr:cbb3-type cytochrome c oxidase N-terminal domain-containing protein [Flavobacterium hydrocarbonoxydans]MWB94809.1 c-type cytochrome [Flavobacterium hydrocarbonoxydans]
MKKIFPVYVRVPLIFFIVFGLMEYFIDSGSQPAFVKYPMVLVFLAVFLFILIAIEITLSAVNRVLYQLMSPEEKAKVELEDSLSLKESTWYKNLMQKLTKTQPIEKEGELLLDHDYDGIKELDNNLPPWWVYLFYIGIVFGVIYFARYEVFGGDDQETELKKEMAQAKIDVEEYLKTAPDLMDEKSVVLLTDAPSLEAGKTIFNENCAACHRADGGGQIGPNLTDNKWILGGGIKNLFHTVTNGGRDGKGMIAWKGTLKPKEIQKVSSYILSLQGSNPKDPKEAEGEVWIDESIPKKGSVVAKVTDSTEVKK